MQNLQNPIKIGLATYWLRNCFTTYSSVAIGIRKMSLEMFFIIILLEISVKTVKTVTVESTTISAPTKQVLVLANHS